MSSVPVEIWRDIFLLAVNEPSSFLKEWDARYWSAPHGRDMQTKLSISQVCRLWHALATELLYTHLYFYRQSYDNIERVATVLEQHQHEPGYGYGRATKRIDVRVECLSSRMDVQPLLRLLRVVHNLAALVFIPYPESICGYVTTGSTVAIFHHSPLGHVSRLLEQRFKESFRCLSLDISMSSLVGNILPALPLQMLDLAMSTCSLDPHPCTATVTSLTLDLLNWPENDPLTWHFPSLNTLTLKSMNYRDMQRLDPFLTLNGPLITSFNMIPFKTGPKTINDISHLLNACTHLQNVALPNSFFTRNLIQSGQSVEGEVRIHGVETVSLHDNTMMWHPPQFIFAVIAHTCPDVKCIRHGFRESEMSQRVISFVRKLRAKGIEIQPHLGIIDAQELESEDIMADYSAELFQGVGNH